MSGSDTRFKRYLLPSLAGITVVGVLAHLIMGQANRDLQIQSMEDTIRTLQSSLEAKERQLENIRTHSRAQANTASNAQEKRKSAAGVGGAADGGRVVSGTTGSIQILKDLENVSDDDPRSYAEKLQELLSNDPTEEQAAIASRFVLEKARDRQGLPDYSLQAIYASQTNPDLKRVIAQVMSQRGDDGLLKSHIAESQARLRSARPGDRLVALSQLGKTHSTHAVEAIAPALQDPDSTVRLAALFALRDTGNQRHVNLVETLLDDRDPSVSSLAADVLSSLRNLSSSARTGYSRSDIEAELPPIANP